MKLREFRDILNEIAEPLGVLVYHCEADKAAADYIVWQETGEVQLSADGLEAEKAVRVAVDFYTKEEYSSIPDELQAAFDAYDDFTAGLDAIDYETDTGFFHYAFTAEVLM